MGGKVTKVETEKQIIVRSTLGYFPKGPNH